MKWIDYSLEFHMTYLTYYVLFMQSMCIDMIVKFVTLTYKGDINYDLKVYCDLEIDTVGFWSMKTGFLHLSMLYLVKMWALRSW